VKKGKKKKGSEERKRRGDGEKEGEVFLFLSFVPFPAERAILLCL